MKSSLKALILIILAVFGTEHLYAQYQEPSTPGENRITGLSDFLTDINTEFRHGNAPDSLVNRTDIDLFVHIEGPKDSTFPGLQERPMQGGSMQYSRELKSGSAKQVNVKKLRRGVSPQNKVRLVIRVPGVMDSQGNWTTKPIKWNLGKGHIPSFTEINYLNEKDGYEIIFRYDKGLPPRNSEESEQHKRVHIEAHFCEPQDEKCL